MLYTKFESFSAIGQSIPLKTILKILPYMSMAETLVIWPKLFQ